MKNYEKEYTQALERAKEMLVYKEVRQEDMEYLFPELKEKKSDDKRMKKAIMHVLYENYTDAAVIEGVEIAEIVAWLEKQCKQKQTWEPSAAQLIVIKNLIEDKNTSKVNKVILRGMFDEFKQFTNTNKGEIDYYECKNSRDQD